MSASPKPPNGDLRLRDYEPRSRLVVPETSVLRPRFPVIDAHNHLGEEFGGGWINRPVEELLDVLDQAGVKMLFDMDGGWGERSSSSTSTTSGMPRLSASSISVASPGNAGRS